MTFYSLTETENQIIEEIKKTTELGNRDNLSRTKFYQQYYCRNKEIIWAFLASLVSRNAGWNMTDLEGEIYQELLPKQFRELLFLTYERANWLIFTDAYPQLLIYEISKKIEVPLFHLLKIFHVSTFMEQQWQHFWIKKDIEHLCKALIINEQNVIQKPVNEDSFYHEQIFSSIPFFIDDKLRYNTVIFPTLEGKLYGYSVHGFTKVKNRINLGKQLTWVLFHSNVSGKINEFASNVEHTGSRYDYEKYVKKIARKRTPELRATFPIVYHHRSNLTDWYNKKTAKKVDKYFEESSIVEKFDLTDWYYKKQQQLYLAAKIEQKLLKFFNVKEEADI